MDCFNISYGTTFFTQWCRVVDVVDILQKLIS